MSDIVERLRKSAASAPLSCSDLHRHAADEIERLQNEHDSMAKHLEAAHLAWDGLDVDRMALRARVEELEAKNEKVTD